jgi:hypothetical protein
MVHELLRRQKVGGSRLAQGCSLSAIVGRADMVGGVYEANEGE